MANPTDDVLTIGAHSSFGKHEDRAYARGTCPSCGALQFIVIAVTKNRDRIWLRCISCKLAIAVNEGIASPAQKPLRVPAGLPGEEAKVWDEIRECLGVGAYTAAVMLCRKLLMHVAVAHGLPAKDGKDRAPNFTQCVDHLVVEGIVTKRMEPWIDRIREVGNEANHEISPVGKDAALDVATFTQKLLELAYEMDDTMVKADPNPEDATEDSTDETGAIGEPVRSINI
ncbi:DUF4145 domain-containing protein [Microbacterium sp. ISL-59]|uniref:DUF4145 domain-containing protein n=1 Tax=Microbacterium sp. ISL-59 TaxID=2819159 RepID=UPI001BE5EF23|nr:DUF4145 domain-containing protein [Microbacterium sp. ISL-59]MBT2495073.1 DUF4145 domain-containing protein [Microbacterium sp. ISL-59]